MTFSVMSSRLVETMMINVEDFADSFLTCGTCLSGYDSAAHSAKLLPCSHTICRTCLERILETQPDEETMRCPICRETIMVPHGGASTFPPAFIVNQLLDLLANQRRDRVPKCRFHPNQELLFCETCDVIFCPDCRGGSTRSHATEACSGILALSSGLDTGCSSDASLLNSGSGGGGGTGGGGSAALSHNVISFSVAIKRCSEILLYKASLCVQELNSAQEAVTAELHRLTESSDACIAAAESSFAEIRALVERRQAEVIQSIKRISEEKRRALEDQLALIESERSLVRGQCDSLNDLIDVRSISKGISYLNDKLDTIASLTEPRENAFLRYQDNPAVPRPSPVGRTNSVAIEASPAQAQSHHPDPGTAGFVDVARCLAAFGRIAVSTTYPPLCTATLPSEVHINLPSKVLVRAFDYHGQPQTTGTDPIVVRFVDAHGREAPSQLVDLGNGSYEITILPINAGPHKLSVNIISRPIRGSPFRIAVRSRQKPRWSINEGLDGRGLVQPFAVSVVRSSRFPPAPAPAATTNTTSSSSLPSSEASSSSSTLNGYESGGCGVDEVAQSNGSCVPAAGDGGGGDAPFPSSSSSDCVLLLDTGNSRLLVADGETGQVTSALVNDALKGQAATGMALCPEGLWVVNWRANELLLLDIATNEIRRRVSSPHFVEPTSVCVCPRTGRVLVADNGAGCVFACLDGTVTALIGASCCDTATAPTTAAAGTAGGRGARQFDRLVHDALRRVTGLCVMSSGEIVLAAGSELRIYSSEGAHIGNLYPPLGAGFLQLPQQPPSSTNGDGFPSHPNQNSLRQAQCTTLVPPIVGLSSAPGSTLTLDSAAHRPLRRPPSVGGSMRPSSGVGVAGALRGHFGGVTAAPRATSDLGECLLASHTDRTRSAVVVYPEAAWRGAITGVSGGGADGYTATNSTESMRDDCLRDLGASLMRQVKRQPYVLEVEPGLRRLAGLIAFPTASTIVAVDLGGQCAHCLRYA